MQRIGYLAVAGVRPLSERPFFGLPSSFGGRWARTFLTKASNLGRVLGFKASASN